MEQGEHRQHRNHCQKEMPSSPVPGLILCPAVPVSLQCLWLQDTTRSCQVIGRTQAPGVYKSGMTWETASHLSQKATAVELGGKSPWLEQGESITAVTPELGSAPAQGHPPGKWSGQCGARSLPLLMSPVSLPCILAN